ncbi:type II secretion system F family protein [Nocardia pseudobrasiliensis]|uniref:Type II secretion system protein F (GspF) n=1 Tax=Nocardia pseudobrasiliensis TaxID=45979 RepID=A0A370I5M6_9NOCA|nr:type II secretion system F family protein [Nocardia pseudobrasiliensis]RDI66022.1 type II secretion system protein F (GspF) [Nocardia pseudobrasiliensis]
MSAVLFCLALAMIALPARTGRRRFEALFGGPRSTRKPQSAWMVRAALLCALGATAVLGLGALLATAMVGATVGTRLRRGRKEQRRIAQCRALADGLAVVIGELRVGAHPGAAAATAAEESDGTAAHAFAACAARSRLGGRPADGLRDPHAPIATELARIAEAWQLADQHGLALADLLTTARADLLARIRFRDRTRAALAGPRATATILAALPLLGITLGHLMGASPLSILLHPGPGALLLPLGTALACTGILWTDALTRKALI